MSRMHVRNASIHKIDKISTDPDLDPPDRKPSPEKNLLYALLERAVLDLDSSDMKIRRAARSWVLYPTEEFFSFEYICEAVDLPIEAKKKVILMAQRARVYYSVPPPVPAPRLPSFKEWLLGLSER